MRRRELLGVLGGALGGTAIAWPVGVRAQQTPPVTSTLRIGKAGRDAFSFVPADIGVQTGIFKKHCH
jgi:hypothetical protein